MEKISQAQQKFLDSLEKWFKDHGHPPTLRELSKCSGLKSTWTVRYHLNKLQEAGYIKMKKGLSRAVSILRSAYSVPLIGRVSAGLPIDAVENTEVYLNLGDMLGNLDDVFALKVKGDSMTGAGIFNGDIVFIKKQSGASNGDIVAASIGDEAVIKRIFIEEDHVRLVSENPAYKPIISKTARVVGKLIAVVRNY